VSKRNKLEMLILNWKISLTITNLYPKHEGATRGHEGSIKQTNSAFIIRFDNNFKKFLLLDNIVLKILTKPSKIKTPIGRNGGRLCKS